MAVVGMSVSLGMITGCSDTSSSSPESAPPSAEKSPTGTATHRVEVVRTDFDTDEITRLPWVRRGATTMPRSIPDPNSPLPSLLTHLPGRAVLVVNPRITVLGAPVASWSDLRLEFYGADHRWTRLSLGDLGLPDSQTALDTYGAGLLSDDGRWWAGGTRDGIVALDLETGRVHTYSGVDLGTWIPGQHAILGNHRTISIPSGQTTHVPYSWSTAGFAPDGTPLSWQRTGHRATALVAWTGDTHRQVATVSDLKPPPGGRFAPVQATEGRAASTESTEPRVWISVVDTRSGRIIATLDHDPGSALTYQAWTDRDTFVIAQTPYFLVWNPGSGRLSRVTDAGSLTGAYWDVSLAAPSTS
ncbi:MAG: hypothetical protein QM747_19275 [Nocardioides sp.]